MNLKNKILLKDLRTKLTPKQVALFKLVIWCVLLVWMVFFLTFGIAIAIQMHKQIPLIFSLIFPDTTFYRALAWIIPGWFVFTIGLIELIIARWAYRKLRRKDIKNNGQKGGQSEDK